MMRVTLLLAMVVFGNQALAQDTTKESVKKNSLGKTVNVSSCGELFLAGQPTQQDLQLIAGKGIKRVISLRTGPEVRWDEAGAVKKAGMQFIAVPVSRSISDKQFDAVRKLLQSDQKTLLHCGSAVRVGAVWLPFRVLDQGVPVEKAIEESKVIGLPAGGYLDQAVAYIERNQKEKSVRPGINDSYLAKDLKIEEWVKRFEGESREIYSNRLKVVEACKIKPGMRIADVGSGTGLYTRLFADRVGEDGWVYAVDIVPTFLKHILDGATRTKTNNVSAVLCAENSVRLPPGSVDLVFICDVYHHFEYPRSTMKSIKRALKPGGQLIVIDFERIKGKSRKFVMGHVRAGKEIFRREIEDAGFKLAEEVKVDGLKENYFLRFDPK